MPKRQMELTIQVTFTENGERLETVIQKSFQTFIQRNLQNSIDFLTKRP